MLKNQRTGIDELEGILGGDNKLAPSLIQELGETEALRIGRLAARKITNPVHRKKYVMASVQIQKRIAELEAWLDRNRPLEEIMDDDDIRALPDGEIRERHRERRKREEEIAALKGEVCGYDKLVARVGLASAAEMFNLLTKCFLPPGGPNAPRRVNTILLKASEARYPRRYVMSCIEAEHKARLAKRKNQRRKPAKPKPRGNG